MIDLFSSSFLDIAHIVLPEKVKEPKWFKEIWTEEELIKCKNYEFREFIKYESLDKLPNKKELLEFSKGERLGKEIDKTTRTVDDILFKNKNIKTIISIGSHIGLKEIWLSRRHQNVHFYCTDIIPFINILNKVVKKLKINNVTFFESKNLEMIKKRKKIDTFDLVYSHAVIYCISNNKLKGFFEHLSKICKKNGLIVVGDASNLSFFGLIRYYIIKFSQFRYYFLKKKVYKKSGWSRNWKIIKKHIPKNLSILRVEFFNHYNQIPLGKNLKYFAFPIYLFSKYIYPISNGSFLFVIKNCNKQFK